MKSHHQMSMQTIEMIANRFKVLSEPMRLQILHGLQKGEQSVSQMVSRLETSQPNISKHLRMLQEAGLVTRRQEGNTVFYSIADESIFEMCETVCGSLKIQAEEKVNALSAS